MNYSPALSFLTFWGCLLQLQQTHAIPIWCCLLFPAELGPFRYRGCQTGAMSPPTMSYDGPGPGMGRHFPPQPVGLCPLSRNVPNHGSGFSQAYSRPVLSCPNKKLHSGFSMLLSTIYFPWVTSSATHAQLTDINMVSRFLTRPSCMGNRTPSTYRAYPHPCQPLLSLSFLSGGSEIHCCLQFWQV
ncbi:hypothetical protein B0H65DRAFT_31179 [Neurospora tetraspora]|uniref:Secreted protein n=1 Tax=Neurospora tetraspora TaxID=94610 RepID=A0AAE0MXD5_9PEZI|nr:hypothetical protein B0H65DRAFT_31179 [Neurospora tetraspora]